ncbi:SnoaL-like domain-containing protein [Mucilaginibacter sp. HD30]
MRTVRAISHRLIELLRKQEFVQAYNELFNAEAESIDPLNPRPGGLKGLLQLIKAEELFLSKVQIHTIEISEAIHAGNYFSISLFMRFHLEGEDRSIDELCVYKVKEGEIVSQQFFI